MDIKEKKCSKRKVNKTGREGDKMKSCNRNKGTPSFCVLQPQKNQTCLPHVSDTFPECYLVLADAKSSAYIL